MCQLTPKQCSSHHSGADQAVQAWSLETYEQLARVHAHQQAVLGLSLSEDNTLLFSCGVDSVVNVSRHWHPKTRLKV